MAYEVLPIALQPGIRQDADRAMLPAGSLIAASGCRIRKGGIAKQNGLIDAGVTAHAGVFSGPCDALGYAAGRQIAVMNGQTWGREDFGDPWTELGRASRARPVKAHWSAFSETASAGVIHPACATIGDYVATVYDDGTDTHLAATDGSGIRRFSHRIATRDRPRIFAVGSVYILTYRNSTNIYARTVNATTFALGTETFVGNIETSTDVYDAAPFSSTQWLLWRRNGATTATVSLWDTALAGEIANEAVTVANNDFTAACVFGTDGEGIWATLENLTGQYMCAFAEDLSSTTGAPAGFASFAGGFPAVMTRRDASTVWVVWTEVSSGPTRYLMRLGAFGTDAALSGGNVGYAWHLHPASRPWGGSTTRVSLWVHTDGGTEEWAVQRRYALVTLSMDLDVPSAFGMLIEPEFSPDERSNIQQSFHAPEVAFRSVTDESGASVQRGFLPALATIRTQDSAVTGTAAILLYEWETESGFHARARQVAEVGGQGVVFGGGLQEIPSARLSPFGIDSEARGVENGFLYAPAILAATLDSGGSLTADALYKFVAVFEYISPDGLRVRSAPSNIVEVTPSGSTLTVDLEISSAPTTEREFSAPPNQTVVHVYGTVGGGGSYVRITPDGGLSAGRGGIADGLIEFSAAEADEDIEANETVYTEREAANQPAPAHRFGWTGGGYAWAAGLFNPHLIERSKQATPNEPVQFTRQNTHRCLLPEACTGGAWLDNVSVVFSRTGIYLVPPTLGAPQRLPSTVGCLDFRSVVELPEGIGFQSRRGYELLPRGFGAPQLISGPVENELRGRRVISATVTGHGGSDFASSAVHGERKLVLFAIEPSLASDPGVRLSLDLDSGRWTSSDAAMSDSGAIGEVLTTWAGRLVVASRSGTIIRYEDPTDWGSVAAVPVSFTLADLRPFGLMSRGQIRGVQILGEYRSATKITITAYQDGRFSQPLPFQKATETVTGTAGDKFTLEWGLPVRQVNALSLKFDLADADSSSPGEGVVIHAIGIEAEGLPGRPRTTQERTAA